MMFLWCGLCISLLARLGSRGDREPHRAKECVVPRGTTKKMIEPSPAHVTFYCSLHLPVSLCIASRMQSTKAAPFTALVYLRRCFAGGCTTLCSHRIRQSHTHTRPYSVDAADISGVLSRRSARTHSECTVSRYPGSCFVHVTPPHQRPSQPLQVRPSAGAPRHLLLCHRRPPLAR